VTCAVGHGVEDVELVGGATKQNNLPTVMSGGTEGEGNNRSGVGSS